MPHNSTRAFARRFRAAGGTEASLREVLRWLRGMDAAWRLYAHDWLRDVLDEEEGKTR